MKVSIAKVNFRKGAGTMIEFVVVMIACVILVTASTLVARLSFNQTTLNAALNYIGREIIVEDSLEDAQARANYLAREILNAQVFERRSVQTTVRYALHTTDWRKGGFIELVISAKGRGYIGRFENSTLMMIE